MMHGTQGGGASAATGGQSGTFNLIDPETGKALSRLQTWLTLIVMLSGATFVALVIASIAPIMHQMSNHFGDVGAGRYIAYGVAVFPSIGIMIGAPLSGWIIERVGSRRFLLAILLIYAIAGSAGLYVEAVGPLLVSRLIVGFAAAGLVTCTVIMIGEYFDPAARGRVLGYQGAIAAVSGLLIVLSSGQLASWAGWRAPFAMYLLALPIFIATLIAVPKQPAFHQRKIKETVPPGTFTALLPVLALIVLLCIGVYMPTLQLSFLLADIGVLKPSNQSFVMAVTALMACTASLAYGSVQLRLGDSKMLQLSAGLMGMGIVVMGLAPSAGVVAVGCALAGMGTGLLGPHINNMLIGRSPPGARGRATGLGYTARYIGDFLNPAIFQPVRQAIGIHGAFIVLGAAFVVAALVSPLVRRSRKAVEQTPKRLRGEYP